MYALDFEYDGHYLSDYGFMLCTFDGSRGAQVVDSGCNIQFNKVATNGGKKSSLTSTQYSDCLQATFQICKDPEKYLTEEELMITKDEYRDIARWLNRGQFCRFQIIYDVSDDVYNSEPCYYNASFNIKRITIGDKVFGVELTMETDSPFGYGSEIEIEKTLDATSGYSFTIYDNSDDIGYIYPDIELICLSSEDYTIVCEPFGTTTTIGGCTQGETIDLYGNSKIISTSLDAHNVAADFNFSFPKIGNTFESSKNTITVNAPCIIKITYSPIIKDYL